MKKILTLMFVSLFMISLVSAVTVKQFDKQVGQYGKVELKSKAWIDFFGWWESDVEDLVLTENTDTCAEDCYAIKEITLYEESSLVEDVRFETIKEDGRRIEQPIRSYNFYIKTNEEEYSVDDYEYQCVGTGRITVNGTEEQSCSNVKVGSHIEVTPLWKEYKIGEKLPAGDYTLKLEGQKKPSRTVDWVIKSQGVWITEWAVWKGIDELVKLGEYDVSAQSATPLGMVVSPDGTVAVTTDYSNGEVQSYYMTTPFNINTSVVLETYVATAQVAQAHSVIFSPNGTTMVILDYGDKAYQYGLTSAWNVSTASYSGKSLTLTTNINTLAFNNDGTKFYTTGYANIVFQYGLSLAYDISTASYEANYSAVSEDNSMRSVFIHPDGNKMYLGGTQNKKVYQYTLSTPYDVSSATYDSLFYDFSTVDTDQSQVHITSDGAYFYIAGNQNDKLYWYSLGQAAVSVDLNSPSDNYISSTSLITFSGNASSGGGSTLTNMSLWHNATGTWARNKTEVVTGTSNTTTFNQTFSDGSNVLWTIEACNSDGTCGFANENRTVKVDTTLPTITINSPATSVDYGFVGKNETLNWSVTDTNLDSIWYNYNGTNVTVYGAENETTFTLQQGNYNVTVYANDTAGNLNSTFVSWSYRLFLINETYVSSTTEGAENDFSISLTTNGTVISLAYLNYNNTLSIGSITSSGNNYTLTRSQIAPSLEGTSDVPFYWNITMQDGFNYVTDSKNQSVSSITINTTCSGMYVLMNLTLIDEITQQKINGTSYNSSIKIDLDLYNYARTQLFVDYFQSLSSTNPVAICINSNLTGGETYSLDAQIQYSATNYSSEFYNIENYVINESSLNRNISLYDLDNSNAQSFRLIARDSSYIPLNNALIQIERKYLENGTFLISEIPKTDADGITTASLELDDAIYNFLVYQSGILISSFTNVKAICQTPAISTCEIELTATPSSIEITDFETADDFNFTLGYNSTSRIVSSQFVIPSNTPSTIQLVVTKDDALGTSVCTDSIVSTSGLLSCSIPSSFGNSTIIAKLYKDGFEIGKGNIDLKQKPSEIFGVVLVVLGVIVMITLIGISISDSPIVTLVFLFVGVILLFSMSLASKNGFIGATASILFLAIAIIIVLIKASRRS